MAEAAADERLDADRRRPARPRFPGQCGEGRADPRTNSRPARAPRGGARAARGIPDGREGGGSGRLRARARMTDAETLPWDEQQALDDARYRTQLRYLFERSAF